MKETGINTSEAGGMSSSLPYVRPNLLNVGAGLQTDFDDRRLNDGSVEIMLIDLDRQDKIAADFYRQREACLQEIKANRVESAKVLSHSL